MRSIDSIRSRQDPQERNDRIVQPSLLALFPSVDYSRANLHTNTKIAMKTRLKILFKAAEDGFVTKYELTKPAAEPRLGGETVEKALRDLEKMQLLSVTQHAGRTGSKRNDYSLTSKGLIVCLVFKKYQRNEDFSLLVKKLNTVKDELAFTLLMYNRFPPRIMDILKELADKHLNFERTTDESIVLEIRKTADLLALRDDNNPVELIADLLMIAPEDILVKISQRLIAMNKDVKEFLKEAPEERAWARKILSSVLAGLFSLFVSPEFRLWIVCGQDFNELHLLLDKMRSKAINDEVEISKLFDAMRTEMRERLKGSIEVNNFL